VTRDREAVRTRCIARRIAADGISRALDGTTSIVELRTIETAHARVREHEALVDFLGLLLLHRSRVRDAGAAASRPTLLAAGIARWVADIAAVDIPEVRILKGTDTRVREHETLVDFLGLLFFHRLHVRDAGTAASRPTCCTTAIARRVTVVAAVDVLEVLVLEGTDTRVCEYEALVGLRRPLLLHR